MVAVQVLVSLLVVTLVVVSCHAAKYELMVAVYDSSTCTGEVYGTWTYDSNTTCFKVVQPPVPTMYVNITSLTGDVYGSICDTCGSGAKCTGKYMEGTCYSVDKLIHSTEYPLGVKFEYYRVPSKVTTNCKECMVKCKEQVSKENVQVTFDLNVDDEVMVTM